MTATPTLPAGVRTTLSWSVLAPSWAIGLLVVPFALGADVPLWLQIVPFGVSLLLFGLPHGAVDHLAVGRASSLEHPRWLVAGLYLVCGGGYLAVWFVAPVLAAVAFIALTWYHWGQGDCYTLLSSVEGTHLRSRAQRCGALLVRGGLPMLVPLLAAPDVYASVVRGLVAPFAPGAASDSLGWAIAAEVRLAAGLGFAALTGGTLALGYARADDPRSRDAWRIDTFETVLLWAYFLVVPPVLAVGLYFTLWHSTRHIARVVALDGAGRTALAGGRVGSALAGFAREALPATLGAGCFLGALFVVRPAADPMGLLALYLVALAVLTVPHALVVTWLDVSQDLWTPREAP
jgi:Brp/Blh family beta-carotene 15,15'-monooxygenase